MRMKNEREINKKEMFFSTLRPFKLMLSSECLMLNLIHFNLIERSEFLDPQPFVTKGLNCTMKSMAWYRPKSKTVFPSQFKSSEDGSVFVWRP